MHSGLILFSIFVILFFTEIENNSAMDMNWLKSEMARKGLSNRKLGEAVGLSDAQMSLVLSGARQLKATEQERIWRLFGYPIPGSEQDDRDLRLVRALKKLSETERAAIETLILSHAERYAHEAVGQYEAEEEAMSY